MSEIIELTPYEQSMLALLEPVTTLHHFRGKHKEEFLRGRLVEIISANLYLAGRLVTAFDEKQNKRMALRVPPTLDHIDWHFKLYHSQLNPFHGLSCGDIRSRFRQYFVKPGYACMDKIGEEGILYRVTLFCYENGFSILTSLSHVLGDGKTFYRLLGMMNEINGKVVSLCPYRLPHFQRTLDELVGKAMTDCMNSWSLITGYVINYLLYPKTSTHVFRLRSSYLAARKQRFQSTSRSGKEGLVSFISSNDIIMNVLATDIWHSDFASLTISLRDRAYTGEEDSYQVPVEDRAGNVIFPIMLLKEELQTAATIRARITTLSNKQAASSFLSNLAASGQAVNRYPSIWQQFCMNGVYFISNWAGFHEPVRFTDATSICHIPLTMGGGSNGVHAAIICQLQDDSRNVKEYEDGGGIGLMVTTTEALMNQLRAHPMIEKELL